MSPIEALCQLVAALQANNLPGTLTVKVPFRTYQALVQEAGRDRVFVCVELTPPPSLRRLSVFYVGATPVYFEEDI